MKAIASLLLFSSAYAGTVEIDCFTLNVGGITIGMPRENFPTEVFVRVGDTPPYKEAVIQCPSAVDGNQAASAGVVTTATYPIVVVSSTGFTFGPPGYNVDVTGNIILTYTGTVAEPSIVVVRSGGTISAGTGMTCADPADGRCTSTAAAASVTVADVPDATKMYGIVDCDGANGAAAGTIDSVAFTCNSAPSTSTLVLSPVIASATVGTAYAITGATGQFDTMTTNVMASNGFFLPFTCPTSTTLGPCTVILPVLTPPGSYTVDVIERVLPATCTNFACSSISGDTTSCAAATATSLATACTAGATVALITNCTAATITPVAPEVPGSVVCIPAATLTNAQASITTLNSLAAGGASALALRNYVNSLGAAGFATYVSTGCMTCIATASPFLTCLTCGSVAAFGTSGTTRQANQQAVVVCPATGTVATQEACLRTAICFGANGAAGQCMIGGANVTCPSCPSSSKKGLLGLLGLLGIIPLLLSCSLLFFCCCRGTKTQGDVHFATFDPHAGAPVSVCDVAPTNLYATGFGNTACPAVV